MNDLNLSKLSLEDQEQQQQQLQQQQQQLQQLQQQQPTQVDNNYNTPVKYPNNNTQPPNSNKKLDKDQQQSPTHPRQRIQFYQDENDNSSQISPILQSQSPPIVSMVGQQPVPYETHQAPQPLATLQPSQIQPPYHQFDNNGQPVSVPQFYQTQPSQLPIPHHQFDSNGQPIIVPQFYQSPSTTTTTSSSPPPQVLQPLQSVIPTTTTSDIIVQNDESTTSIDFNGIEIKDNSKDWFNEILNYQKQQNQQQQQHNDNIDEYIKNHNQFKMKENLEKKNYESIESIKNELENLKQNQTILSSSTLLLNRFDQFNKTNLPNGLLLSPFYKPIITPQSYQYQPPKCKSCFSFINLYCELKEKPTQQSQKQQIKSNKEWICSICKNVNEINENNGWWFTQHYKSVFSSETYDIKIKKNNKLNNNNINKKNKNKNNISPSIIDQQNYDYDDNDDNDNRDEENQKVKDTSDQVNHMNGDNDDDDDSNTYLFLIDENISISDLKEIIESIKLLINKLSTSSSSSSSSNSGNIKVGLITFSKNISIFELNTIQNNNNKEGLLMFNSARLVSGLQSLDSSNKYELQRKRRLYFETIDNNNNNNSIDNNDISKSKIEGNKINLVLNSLLETFENNGTSTVYENKQVSLGVAIECALRIVKGNENQTNNNGGRIFIFLNGAPDYGPGAIPRSEDSLFVNCSSGKRLNVTTEEKSILNNAQQYYEQLGEKAFRQGFAIDLQLIGYNNFEIKILSSLTLPSGMISCSLDAHSDNLSIPRSTLLFENMFNSINCNSGIFGQLDIHTPDSIELTHLIGPTIKNKIDKVKFNYQQRINSNQDDELLELIDDDDNDKYTSFILSNLQQDICYSIYYQLLEDIPFDYVNLQFVIHLIRSNGSIKITRVITKQFKLTGNFDKYLQSLDFNVLSILLSKKLILQSIKDNNNKLLNDSTISNYNNNNNNDINHLQLIEFDKLVSKITLSCSKVEKSWLGLKKTIIIPEIIKQFIMNQLYKIRKSIIFGSIIQNDDDLIIYQQYLLNSNFNDCKKLLLPNLLKVLEFNNNNNSLQSSPSYQFINIPLDVCSINSNSILILDCFINIYIMIGSNVQQNEEKLTKLLNDYIKEIKINRLPSPYIIKFNESNHNVRWLKSLLLSSESYPLEKRWEIIKEIYPQYSNIDINDHIQSKSILNQFNDPFTNDPLTPYNYFREINSKIYDYFI